MGREGPEDNRLRIETFFLSLFLVKRLPKLSGKWERTDGGTRERREESLWKY